MQAFIVSLLAMSVGASKCPSTVTPQCHNLDFSKYQGLWYEQVNSKAFIIDANLRCVTANYSANADGTIKVLNVGTQSSPTGALTTAEGKATIKDASTCDLGVKFSGLQPFDAPYQVWDTDYESYAIVISCLPVLNALGQSDIWILSRVPNLPTEKLNALLQKLEDNGFDYSDKRYQVHTSDCQYYSETSLMESDGTGSPSAQKAVDARDGSLVTFDGTAATSFKFQELNDPVMGGRSTGTWSLGDGFGILDGEVVDVPSLKAPGFIKAAADGTFPDISAFIGGSLVLSVRTSTPDYAGYHVTFVSGAASASYSCAGGGSLPFSRGCFKQKFSVPAGSDFVEVKLPFNNFSDKWSSATGEHTTECAQDQDVCPTAAKLSSIQRVEFWGEGAAGKLHLEVKSVFAEMPSGERIVMV
jgi:apolipoprotein D and lipocalin family protein